MKLKVLSCLEDPSFGVVTLKMGKIKPYSSLGSSPSIWAVSFMHHLELHVWMLSVVSYQGMQYMCNLGKPISKGLHPLIHNI